MHLDQSRASATTSAITAGARRGDLRAAPQPSWLRGGIVQGLRSGTGPTLSAAWRPISGARGRSHAKVTGARTAKATEKTTARRTSMDASCVGLSLHLARPAGVRWRTGGVSRFDLAAEPTVLGALDRDLSRADTPWHRHWRPHAIPGPGGRRHLVLRNAFSSTSRRSCLPARRGAGRTETY